MMTRLKVGVAPVVLGMALIATPSYAQKAEEGASDDTIIVTGSRIERRDLESASPLAVVASEEFALSGAVNVEQVVNTLPQVVPGTTAFSNNPGGGVATLNLRGLGSARTLVLVNGRRYVSFDTSQVVDLNTIPQFMLESVDVVTGGASAVYGSDALAGVVNFRLKQDFTGLEVGSQYSITGKGDGGRFQAHAAIGASFDDGRGNVVAFGEYYKRKPIFQGARAFSRFALGDDGTGLSPGGSATTPQGRIAIAGRQSIATICNGTTVVVAGFGGDTNCDGVTDATDAASLARGAGNFGSAFGANFAQPGVSDVFDFPGDLYNYAPANYLMVPQERFLAGAYGNYEINDNITAFMEVTFVNNRVANELAPTPVTGTFDMNIAANAGYLSAADLAAIQATDANETAINAALNARCAAAVAAGLTPAGTVKAAGCATTGTGATATYTGSALASALLPGAGTVRMGINRRIVETGSRNSLDERNAFRILAGLKGEAFAGWNYEAYYSYARTRNANIQAGNISRSAFTNAVQTGAINIFGPNTLSQSDVDSISILAQNGEVSVLQVASASLSGKLGNLGLGADDIGLAIGGEWRSMNAQFLPDTALSSGDVIGFNAGDPTSGSYSVKEVFAEVRVPLIADAPFAHRLELNAAGRYSDYSLAAVGTTWTYAAGAEWAPVKDISFRGQYQRAVRAPNVGELFGGQSNGFPGATDPCSNRAGAAAQTAAVRALCVATGVPAASVFTAGVQPNAQIEGLFGGNPNLQEETSDTYTFGAVIRPTFVPRLNISVDYFNIKVSDYISTLGGGLNNTLNLCYNVIQDINSVYCQAIANGGRDPATGIIGGDFTPLIGNANVAKLQTSGVDFQVDYSVPLSFGVMSNESKLSFSTLATYTIKNKFFAVQELSEFTDCAGRFGQSVCGNPQPTWKWNSRLSWLDGPLTTSIRWRHLGKVRDDDDATDYVVENLKSYDVFDLSLSADVTDNLSLSAGVNNVFNKIPQLIGDNQEQANTYPGVYDVLGRDFFVSVNFKF